MISIGRGRVRIGDDLPIFVGFAGDNDISINVVYCDSLLSDTPVFRLNMIFYYIFAEKSRFSSKKDPCGVFSNTLKLALQAVN